MSSVYRKSSPAGVTRRIALAVALGVLTTIVIAWLGAAFEKAYHAPKFYEVLVFDNFTSRYFLTCGQTITRVGTNWDPRSPGTSVDPSWIHPGPERDRAHAPPWSQAWLKTKPARPPGTWGDPAHPATLNEFAAGWPLRALWCESDEPVQDPVTKLAVYTHRGAIQLPCHVVRDGATIFLPRALPYWVLPIGFAADTALFAALFALVLFRPAMIRARRRQKGKCPACGYELRGLPPSAERCPECGESLPRIVGETGMVSA